ncbi:MAG TPA: isoprenylcysteine carboxylmethyltransferase family protein [Verrucomicrobiae bacterium]
MNPPAHTDTKGLIRKLVFRSLFGQMALLFLLFVPAGTFHFWQAWAFLGLNLVLMLTSCIYFYFHDRQLLARRMLTKEKFWTQKGIMLALKIVGTLGYGAAGLDQHMGWTATRFGVIPVWLNIVALAGVAGGYILFVFVLKANRYAASVIQTESEQTVISQGPYRYVRHPMYLASTIMTLAVPVALGSLLALPCFLSVILLLVLRLLHEEKTLKRDLPGYADYCQRTRYRLIPSVW